MSTSEAQEQRPQHQTDLDDEDDTVKQLNQCSSLYLALQDCLVNTNRNWRACQKEVQALKACNDGRNKSKSQ
ncbi:hypothetical protein Leryth_001874 [Lithospermum erythrorhizon]|uniref:CHCH domain-containing protein n=1 Tax=Lithospermum erythrorhizon TaxID=34254 RepID=A0AAV3QUW4_LITER|nr:hypothetical protein Leryth_001874 [Lithospermum erythrorhizon]